MRAIDDERRVVRDTPGEHANGRGEVRGIPAGLESDQRSAKDAIDEFTAPGEHSKHVRRWKWGVKEEPDPRTRQLRPDQRRREQEVVVVDPDRVAVAVCGDQPLGKPLVDGTVCLEVRQRDRNAIDQVVQYRPEHAVADAVVILNQLRRRQFDRRRHAWPGARPIAPRAAVRRDPEQSPGQPTHTFPGRACTDVNAAARPPHAGTRPTPLSARSTVNGSRLDAITRRGLDDIESSSTQPRGGTEVAQSGKQGSGPGTEPEMTRLIRRGELGRLVDADGRPGLGDRPGRRAAGAVQVLRRLDGRGPSHRESGVRRQHQCESAVEDLLHLFSIGSADAVDPQAGRSIRASLDGKIEGMVDDRAVDVCTPPLSSLPT